MIDRGRAQPIVAGATSGMLVPVAIRKEVEEAMKSKPVGRTSPWPLRHILPADVCPAGLPSGTSSDV